MRSTFLPVKILLIIGFGVQTLSAQDVTPVLERNEAMQIADSQRRLADRYELLEEKLFTLYEYERDSNPARSGILKRAFQQSQEKMTAAQFRLIVEFLDNANLKEAESRQGLVLGELKSLLTLLESEDRGKRIRDELKRNLEYLKEVERLVRIQRGVRGQTEGGADSKRLARLQNKTAERASRLADQIKSNEEPAAGAPAGTDPSKLVDGPAGQSPNKSGSAGQDSNGETPSGETRPINPVRKHVEAAMNRMRMAQSKLEKANRSESIEEMQVAEAELEAARKGLEEILRQLREEDIVRTLAVLESRFRQMLERQLRVNETTRQLEATPVDGRKTDFEVHASKLSVEQNLIAAEASRALLLLREDGSSVAFPETVAQLHADMIQVAERLSAAQTGTLTLEIEDDIAETLVYLVRALEVSQQEIENANQQRSGPAGGGKPGQQPLVDSLAEIRMLRGLQQRIVERHKRYSAMLVNPEDKIGSTTDPDLQRALERLSRRQQQLTDIARDIVVGKNQ